MKKQSCFSFFCGLSLYLSWYFLFVIECHTPSGIGILKELAQTLTGLGKPSTANLDLAQLMPGAEVSSSH